MMSLGKECGCLQFHTPSGITCENGHGGADSIEECLRPKQPGELSTLRQQNESLKTLIREVAIPMGEAAERMIGHPDNVKVIQGYLSGNQMKAQKVTVTITMEALSIDCLPGLVARALQQIDDGFENGSLTADDGDVIKWETQRETVEF